jgi:predicted transcriptional regulator
MSTMTLAEIRDLLECEVIVDSGELDRTSVSMAGGADLMSDVLAFIQADALLLTGLTNTQSVRTALVADVKALVYVRGKCPQDEAVELAREGGLPLLRTAMSLYESCGRLYAAGLPGVPLDALERRYGDDGQQGV